MIPIPPERCYRLRYGSTERRNDKEDTLNLLDRNSLRLGWRNRLVANGKAEQGAPDDAGARCGQ